MQGASGTQEIAFLTDDEKQNIIKEKYMKYNEWVTQLNANLLSVPEAERRKVLDYYAEAYADRRAAGFSESEIIEGFGAPYDAAQAILETDEFAEYEPQNSTHVHETEQTSNKSSYSPPPSPYAPPPRSANAKKDYTWAFVLLCIVLAVPIFSLVMAMVGITIGFAVAPFSTIVAGAARIIMGVFNLFAGEVGSGIVHIGIGLIGLGVGIIIIKLCFALIKLMWQLFTKFFKWLSRLFKGANY